ncbi:arsenate reductase [Methylonatrum kenyense]|uniref:arsenate reductase n=1 Tax=Methylonatrum kenyense TaxID=455253 RepID=UPI0020BD580D|nr:arsenate reductase [Methylonatrum kenyense]MCK8514728.1 arsenate reductase [Methylonatrum kenyense]
MTVVYGIPNCDTCRKARRWLEANGIEYRFHDLRADGLDANQVEAWLQRSDASVLVNRRSTTWRQLADGERRQADGPDVARLLAANPTLVKRPLLETDGTCLVGFAEAAWRQALMDARDKA